MRRTVRSPRLAANQEIFQKIYGSTVEIVVIDDLPNGDFTTALQGERKAIFFTSDWPLTPFRGVDAVIHNAAPLAGCMDAASTIVGVTL